MVTPLDGGRCDFCGVVVYPYQDSCPRCTSIAVRHTPLSTNGTLWTWTIQRYAPKSPPYEPPADGFSPFAVGYVELPEGVRVAGIVHSERLDDLAIGAPVRLSGLAGVPRFELESHRE